MKNVLCPFLLLLVFGLDRVARWFGGLDQCRFLPSFDSSFVTWVVMISWGVMVFQQTPRNVDLFAPVSLRCCVRSTSVNSTVSNVGSRPGQNQPIGRAGQNGLLLSCLRVGLLHPLLFCPSIFSWHVVGIVRFPPPNDLCPSSLVRRLRVVMKKGKTGLETGPPL